MEGPAYYIFCDDILVPASACSGYCEISIERFINQVESSLLAIKMYLGLSKCVADGEDTFLGLSV